MLKYPVGYFWLTATEYYNKIKVIGDFTQYIVTYRVLPTADEKLLNLMQKLKYQKLLIETISEII